MDWPDLNVELRRWREAGRSASLWWRDDDACDLTPALERLLALAGDRPLSLAVIPALATPALAARAAATVLQHGYAHRNRAGEGARAVECGGERPLSEVLSELQHGQERLGALFGERFVPVLVPPWNRVAAEVVPRLPELGLHGLSGWKARPAATAAPGVAQVNVHVDVMSYRRGPGFVGREKALGELVEHLAARRTGAADADEPTGLLTHHRDHDEAVWTFLAELLTRLDDAPVHWCRADELFP